MNEYLEGALQGFFIGILMWAVYHAIRRHPRLREREANAVLALAGAVTVVLWVVGNVVFYLLT